jgi:chromosome partitioning protein
VRATLATHLAAYCERGRPVMLGDVDRQQSTQSRLRRAALPLPRSADRRWAVDPSVRWPPAGVRHVILDTPGGLRGFDWRGPPRSPM